MPRILPGVDITVTDKSQVILQNNSVIFAMVGEFERGFTEPTLVSNIDQLENWFGNYTNAPASGKTAYISAVKILETATGMYIANVCGSTATYGGILANSSSNKSAITQTVKTSFEATYSPYVETPVTGENIGADTTGALLSFYDYVDGIPLKPSSLTASATINGVAHTFTDNGRGTFLDPTGLFLDTTNSYVHYNTGRITLIFKAGKAPDASPANVTLAYTKYTIAIAPATPIVAVETTVTAEVLGVGATGVLTYDYTLAYAPIKKGSVTVTAVVSADTKTAIDVSASKVVSSLGLNQFVNDAGTPATLLAASGATSTINYETGAVHLVLTAAATGNITITYKYAQVETFALIATSPKSWSKNYGVTISDINYTENTFKINEFSKDPLTGSITAIQSYTVSRIPGALDGFGNLIYIEDVVASKSNYWVAWNNTGIGGAVLPLANANKFYNGTGTDGTVAAGDYDTAIALFDTPAYSWDVFVGAGLVDTATNAHITEISDLVTSQEKFALVDIKDGTATALKTFMEGTIAINNLRMAIYAPFTYISYNGTEVTCPMSALAARNYAQSVANGNKYMPPAGIERGSISVIRLYRYYTDAEILDLHEAEINVAKFIRGYGNVIFSDFTMQTTTSATSYINSVLTLNDMMATFRSSLVSINFKVINEITFLELRSIMASYLDRLAQQQGTIETNYRLIIDSTNNTAQTKAAREIHADLIFAFQGLAASIKLNLTYTTTDMIATLA